MSLPDFINGVFECCGGVAIALSIVRLHKDKLVRGVSWPHVAFFTSWGFWNLFFYPHLGQWLSFAGGIALVIANAIWLIQIAYYMRREAQQLRAEDTIGEPIGRSIGRPIGEPVKLYRHCDK